jgi:hypothetical protein
MSFRKGSPRHRAAGTVFFVSMPTMAACAVYLGFTKHQMGNVFGGLLTFYLVGTAWATARRRDGETHGFDWIALLVALAVGAIIVTHGLQVATGQRPGDGVPPGMSVFLGSVALIAATGDIRMLLGGGVAGRQRIARHLWRMCFGLFIAAGSFFLGPANRPLRLVSAVFGRPPFTALFSTKLYVFLTILPLILMIFWLVRVRITNAYTRTSAPRTIMEPDETAVRTAF